MRISRALPSRHNRVDVTNILLLKGLKNALKHCCDHLTESEIEYQSRLFGRSLQKQSRESSQVTETRSV